MLGGCGGFEPKENPRGFGWSEGKSNTKGLESFFFQKRLYNKKMFRVQVIGSPIKICLRYEFSSLLISYKKPPSVLQPHFLPYWKKADSKPPQLRRSDDNYTFGFSLTQ